MAAESWVLPTREFRLLWEQRDAAPYPAFAYGGPEHFDNGDLARLADKRLLAQLAAESTAVKEAAFTAFTKPRYSFMITGIARAAEDAKPVVIQVYSAWDGQAQSAFIASQDVAFGSTIGGDVAVTRVDFDRWTAALVAQLPGARSAGRLPQDVDVPVLKDDGADGQFRLSPNVSRSTAAAAFLHLPQTLGVLITVQVGSIADGRRPTTQALQVVDVHDDGRYALLMDSPALAVGVDDKKLASLLNKVVNVTKKRHDAAVVSA